ncbi:MAG: hypothetical protein KDB54_02460 [Solirubrobacterales bacterium]|nr:hypothetical protein [Solirubrobacterales bacterium]
MRGSDFRHRGLVWVVSFALALLAGSTLLTAGSNAAGKGSGPVRLAGSGSSWKVLFPVRLPLNVSGQKVNGRITINLPRGSWTSRWGFTAHAGRLRLGDQRRKFTFIKGVRVPKAVAGVIARRHQAIRTTLKVGYRIPSAELSEVSTGGFASTQTGMPRAGAGFCETLPRLLVRPSSNGAQRIALPACGRKLNWRIGESPRKGKVIRKGRAMLYRPSGGAGVDEFVIEGFRRGRLTAKQRVQVRLLDGDASNISVVAFGDSVTAGFGYFGATGKQMGVTQLDDCRPGATTFNDACSSNSTNRDSSIGTKPNYLPDFGLSRNISWAAQWTNQYGITSYRNYAVTGSAPSDWLPGGQFESTLQSIEQQDPTYILMTMGANPLLSDVLFGVDNMGCALESDLFGDFRQCVLDAFSAVDLNQKLNDLYTSLVSNSTSHIVVMQYHLAVPSTAIAYSATQLEMMTELLNGVISDEAAQVSPSRITVVAPPRFDVGIDMEPLYQSNYSCSFLGYKVDGPSVQATISQDELEVDHPLSFCSGPAIGSPWIISGDTGIHPSAAGYLHMASQVPAPGS